MTGALLRSDGDGPVARCARCGREAAGPCARCHTPVCGDCCVLTEGGARVFAVCLGCEDRGGRSLRPAWGAFLAWLAIPMVALAGLVVLLYWLRG